MARRGSGGRRSGVRATRSTLMPASMPSGTGTTCISPLPGCSGGLACPPARQAYMLSRCWFTASDALCEEGEE